MNPIRISRWAALALAAAIVGCDNPPSPTPSPTPPPGPAVKPAEGKAAENKSTEAKPAKKFDIAGAKLTEKDLASVNKLDEADRKIALEQKLCPITGAHLGAMGKPVKVMLKDQAVFLCCEGCEDDAKAKPEAVLAKLGR